MVTAPIHCGFVWMSFCNVIRFRRFFHQSSCVDDEIVRPLCRAIYSTPQRFSVGEIHVNSLRACGINSELQPCNCRSDTIAINSAALHLICTFVTLRFLECVLRVLASPPITPPSLISTSRGDLNRVLFIFLLKTLDAVAAAVQTTEGTLA